jgi:hypothetical protein
LLGQPRGRHQFFGNLPQRPQRSFHSLHLLTKGGLTFHPTTDFIFFSTIKCP